MTIFCKIFGFIYVTDSQSCAINDDEI